MKFFIVLALAAVALADNTPYRPAPYHPAPSYHPAPAYKPAPSYHEPKYEEGPAKYDYTYAVKDEYAGLDFGADESRDGYATSGSYRVLLPDGRTQTVTYTVDGYSGYVADVQYEGYAKEYHPEPKYHPAPAYKPAPYHA